MEERQETATPINKIGRCPSCNYDWDGGDIREELAKLAVFGNTHPNSITMLSAAYGWSEFNRTRFSRAITTILPKSVDRPVELVLYHCPKCRTIFDSLTGKTGNSIDDFIFNRTENTDQDG